MCLGTWACGIRSGLKSCYGSKSYDLRLAHSRRRRLAGLVGVCRGLHITHFELLKRERATIQGFPAWLSRRAPLR